MKEPVLLEAIVPASAVADSRIVVDVENDDDDDKYYAYYDSPSAADNPASRSLNDSDSSAFLSASALGHGFVSPKDVVVIIFVLCLWLYSIGLMFRYCKTLSRNANLILNVLEGRGIAS